MIEEDIRGCFDALSRGDVEPLVGWLADDCQLEFPGSVFGGTHQGARRIKVFLKQNQRLFEDRIVFTVHWAAVAGDRAIAQWTNAGTTRSGIDYSNRGVTIFHLDRDGQRVTRIEDYLDTEALAETWPR